MADIKELNHSVKISIGAIVFIGLSLVTSTFTVTTIYNQFLLQDEKVQELNTKIDYVNETLRKINKRNKEAIEKVDDRVKKLELPNSDD